VTTPRTWRLAALTAAATAVATLAAVAPLAGPAGATGIDIHRSAKTTVTNGVQQWSIWWNNQHGHQHGYVMSVDLTAAGVSMRPAIGHGMVNVRETTQSIASRTGAIGGVNGDLFDWDTSLPWGGVAVNGVVYKSPPVGRVSQFYVTSKGKVGIGALTWTGSITLIDRYGKPGVSHALYGLNTLATANNGRLALFTPAITSEKLNHCAAVSGSMSGRILTVDRVYYGIGWFPQLAPGRRMLAACGTTGQWLLKHAPRHQRLRLGQHLTTTSGTPVVSFISGQRTLRMDGKAYYDRQGFHTAGINPETAACVSSDHLHVRLITVDGWLGWVNAGNGITLAELGQLTAALHCYSAVVFDGGGSTTMVAQRSGALHIVNQVPTWYGQRPVSNALLVYKS
jgi:hypothetical protein